MGYYTNYKLTTENDITNQQVLDTLRYILIENKEDTNFFYPFIFEMREELADLLLENINELYFTAPEEKWYNHEEDLLKLSNKFPDIIFKLSGKGADYNDIWDKYFYKGKVQKCYAEIIIPEFDINEFE